MSEADNVVELATGQVTPKKPALDVELGMGPLIPNSTWEAWVGQDENGKVIANAQQLVSLDELILMRRKDGQARAILRLFMLPIKAAFATGEWIQPDGEDAKGKGEKETEFANLMWDLPPQAGGMTVSKSKFLRQALLALPDGFAAFEEVRQVPEKGPLKGKITLRKMAYRDSRTVRFIVDDSGGFSGIKQQAAGMPKDVSIPGEKCWYFAHQEEENPYYGVSLLEAAYHHYDVKRKLYYIAHIAAQFAAVPGRIGTTPKNPSTPDLIAFKAALEGFAFNTSMIVKEGYAVEPFNGNSSFDFLKMIDHQNSMMSKSVLAGFLDQENRQVLIDNSGVDASADLFMLSLESIMNELAESWSTYLMPKYIDWNFPDPVYPVFKFGQLTDSSKDAIKEAFMAVVNASVLNCTPEFVRETEVKLAERLGYDIDYEEIAAKEKKAAEEEAKAQALQQAEQQALQAQDPFGGEAAGPPKPPAPGGNPNVVKGQFGGAQDQTVAASNPIVTIDDLVEAAQALLMERPDDPGMDL